MAGKHIFVIGLDDFNRDRLKSIRDADRYTFHGVLTRDEVDGPADYAIESLLQRMEVAIRDTGTPVDAIVGHFDFPVSTTLPILRDRFGLPSPSLESVLKCEHKCWSRTLQKEVVPEATPDFRAFDPFDRRAVAALDLDFPLWVKPVKSLGSYLGFRAEDPRQLDQCLQVIRSTIARIAEPFNYVLRFARLPQWLAPIDGYHCLAEEIISTGHQCTLEGYVYGGEVVVYGVVDSIREPNGTSFNRYQYPSQLPLGAQERMIQAAQTVLLHAGYDNAPFNMEFFYDEERDAIHLLEINPRISESHCPLFEMVDGASHQEVVVDIALGIKPTFPHRQGRFPIAAKFMPRRYDDGIVTRVPDAQRLRQIQQEIPNALIRLNVRQGMRLSELQDQDSYSFELGAVFVGGQNEAQVMERYEQCMAAIDLDFAPPEMEPA